MTTESRRLAGILLVVLPSVMYGGVTLRSMLLWSPEYAANKVRQDLWRAGHAHAGVLLVLSLVLLRYVDEARLSRGMKWFARAAAPLAAIFMPAGFFLSILSPQEHEPNRMIYLTFAGAAILAAGDYAGRGLVAQSRSPI